MSEPGGTPGLPDVSVVPEDVRNVGKYVYGLADALRQALKSAGSEVDSLTDGSWVGDDAAEFATGWSDVRDGGVRIIDALTGMAESWASTPTPSRPPTTAPPTVSAV
jgi:uncharacterized protein YukE